MEHVSLTAFTVTHYYQEIRVVQKAGPANVLPKTATHTKYKTTACKGYNTGKYKNTKLSNIS